MQPETLLSVVRYFSDLGVCDQYMREIKWPGGKIAGGENQGTGLKHA